MWLYGFGDLVCGELGFGVQGVHVSEPGFRLGFGGRGGASEGELRKGILEWRRGI